MMKETLLSKRPRRTAKVDVPEMQTSVYVRALTTGEVTTLSAAMDKDENNESLASKQLHYFLSDENGNQLLSFDEAEQFVKETECIVVRRIVKAGSALNSASDEAIENARGN